MKRNLAYFRCCPNTQAPTGPGLSTVATPTTNLQALEWADAFKSGKVTISDIALAASVFGQASTSSGAAAYFANPLYSSAPASGTVTIGDIAVAASYFDHGLTAPFLDTTHPQFQGAAQGLTQYAPNTDQVDPRIIITTTSSGALAELYYGGLFVNATNNHLTMYFPDVVNPPAPTRIHVWQDGGGNRVACTVAPANCVPADEEGPIHVLLCDIPWSPNPDIQSCIGSASVLTIDVTVLLVNGKEQFVSDSGSLQS